MADVRRHERATPQEKVQKGFRPLVPGFKFGELNDLGQLRRPGRREHCAIWVESDPGRGGGIKPCTARVPAPGLRALCDRHNLLLLLDEVQCGRRAHRPVFRL